MRKTTFDDVDLKFWDRPLFRTKSLFDKATGLPGYEVTPRKIAIIGGTAAFMIVLSVALSNWFPTTTGKFPRFYKSESGFTYKGDPIRYQYVAYFGPADGYFCSNTGKQRKSPLPFKEFTDKLFLYHDEKVQFLFLSVEEMQLELRTTARGISPDIKARIIGIPADSLRRTNS